jgi:membrane protein implicated in regulation of membrane protease activity
MKIVWLVTAIVLAIIEAATVNLVTIWFIASALVSLLLAYLGVSTYIQIAVFVLLGVILLVLTRKPLENLLKKTKQKTNADRVLDMNGIVTEEITEEKPGEVKVDGKKWSAISNKKIVEGSKVEILSIDGVKLNVKEIKEEK